MALPNLLGLLKDGRPAADLLEPIDDRSGQAPKADNAYSTIGMASIVGSSA